MKKILITGANSYVGTSVENWLKQWPEEYVINTLDMQDPAWHNLSFEGYDVVYHVAGIAHVSTDKKLDGLYYKINRDLAIEVAQKAKEDKIKQFIYMSSAIIYGIDAKIGVPVTITKDTIPQPINAYGKSKLEADLAIQKLNCDTFHTVCIRSPMVYGANCKGNYATLRKYANSLPVLPKIQNYRSMIHIENLASFVKERIDRNDFGVFYPQNDAYISTNSIIATIREMNGKKTHYSKLMGWMVTVLSGFIPLFRKIYGNLTFSFDISDTSFIINDFTTSIKKSL